ncbi:putative fatty acyl-CoA reductase CG5065 [Agrilus planipennis]|uniref:Fatty acyl-CoA reductase n=1 Tax=Agrilus planipennis TaxID=224129 RepID=A0A1W4WEK2_AGRPL|nr:putative fatty acyl-CoA reductase CG5065 [Agrilus planipennis]XP_018318437.1 putative fatty acyl-CoA reductase CG5065 [Agrilus planipennis]XP_025834277.1 putative fatty acyl-CoA reductase CG5065 [Agrilus planipennis]
MVAIPSTSSYSRMAAMDIKQAVPTAEITVGDFYSGKTVFVTGGTGFMGKVLLEKLLRSCPGLSKIYVLIRPKRGQDARDRLKELLGSPLFDHLRKERPIDLNKVEAIEGDITQPELAISPSDAARLAHSVNVVFHSAATVKFDEKLKLSVTINMLGTQRLVELCRKMDNLEALVHVSTAYCNCNLTDVEEMIYPSEISAEKVSALVDILDEKTVDELTPNLVGERPNTYTFTKALAESWLKDNKGDLPLAIVRPSIVISSLNGPYKGWVDNWNGPTGIITAAGKGIFRTMLCDPNKKADLIPVDLVINLMIVAAYSIATQKPTREIPVYNCCTGQRKPITWSKFINLALKYTRIYPQSNLVWYPDGCVTQSAFYNNFKRIFLHLIPAYILDSVTWLSGGRPIMLKVQDKLTKAAACLEFFTLHEWNFDDRNVKALSATLNEKDRNEFNFDVAQIDWESYIESYIIGIRRFIFKDEESTLPKARKQVSRLFWTYRILQVLLVIFAWQFLVLRFTPLRQLWTNAFQILIRLARLVFVP